VTWPAPAYSKKQVDQAGRILADFPNCIDEYADIGPFLWAEEVVNNWRACHGYPLHTFQATLRQKASAIDNNAIVAQRLKRLSSIEQKLNRYKDMRLSRMQDIGGLRAIVATGAHTHSLRRSYELCRFQHEMVNCKDYIAYPKPSGYRSIHLVYRYHSQHANNYEGLLLELQIRSRLQHAWATAVETMGIFLNRALKSSEGPEQWLNFFALAGSAVAHLENSPPVPGYERLQRNETFEKLIDSSKRLKARERLLAFTIAVEQVHTERKSGSYHLIVLNQDERSVSVSTFSQSSLELAGKEYSKIEKRIMEGQPLQAVLVSAGPIQQLRHAYPNYFLDTHEFVKLLDRIERLSARGSYL
jgi:putative GTP pyrophosphokinase